MNNGKRNLRECILAQASSLSFVSFPGLKSSSGMNNLGILDSVIASSNIPSAFLLRGRLQVDAYKSELPNGELKNASKSILLLLCRQHTKSWAAERRSKNWCVEALTALNGTWNSNCKMESVVSPFAGDRLLPRLHSFSINARTLDSYWKKVRLPITIVKRTMR